MAPQVNLYDFNRVWTRLQSLGWHSKRGPNGDYFIKPGKDVSDEEGVDYLYGEAAVAMYGLQMGLFEDDAEVDPPTETTTTTGAEAGRQKGKSKMKTEPLPPRVWPDSHPRKGRHVADAISLLDSDEEDEDEELQEEKTPAVDGVKEEEGAETTRPRSGKRKAQRVDEEEGEEGEDDGQDASAMDVDAGWDDGDDDDGAADSDSSPPQLTTRDLWEYINKKNGGKSNGKHYYQPTPMMARKAKPAPRGLLNGSYATPSREVAPPRVPKRASKKQRRAQKLAAEAQAAVQNAPPQPQQPAQNPPAVPVQTSTQPDAEQRSEAPLQQPSAGRIRLAAMKSVSAPRPLVFGSHMARPSHSIQTQFVQSSSSSQALGHGPGAEPQRAVENTQPQQQPVKPLASRGQVSGSQEAQAGAAAQPTPAHGVDEPRVPKSEGAAMKPEPEQGSVQPSTTSPPPPVPRASSVPVPTQAASGAAATTTSSKIDSAKSRIVRLDVDGVVFKQFPEEKYHVLIAEDTDTNETSLEMEEHMTKMKITLSYSDISKFSEPPESIHAIPLTPALVYQALSLLLKRACDTIVVDNPPDGVTTEDDGTPFADFDLVREDQSCEIVMEFPKMSFLRQVHRFPMALVPESPRVQAVLRELQRTKEELEVAQRDIEAFKKQHELLERENLKLRETVEQQRSQQRSVASTPPPQTTVAPHIQVDATPTIAPIPGPAPRAQDTIVFHAQSSWLGTAHPDAAALVTMWALKWERIVEASAYHYDVTTGDSASTMVKIMLRGSYQLNISVVHDKSRQLVVTVTSHTRDVRRQLKLSSVQVIETKNKTTHRSRIDRLIQCDVGDTIVVQLLSRNDSDPLHGDVTMLKNLAAQANKWLMLFVDRQFLVPGESNGTAASQ